MSEHCHLTPVPACPLNPPCLGWHTVLDFAVKRTLRLLRVRVVCTPRLRLARTPRHGMASVRATAPHYACYSLLLPHTLA